MPKKSDGSRRYTTANEINYLKSLGHWKGNFGIIPSPEELRNRRLELLKSFLKTMDNREWPPSVDIDEVRNAAFEMVFELEFERSSE